MYNLWSYIFLFFLKMNPMAKSMQVRVVIGACVGAPCFTSLVEHTGSSTSSLNLKYRITS